MKTQKTIYQKISQDEGNVEWIDDIDSLDNSIKEKNEEKVKKDKTEEKGLFD